MSNSPTSRSTLPTLVAVIALVVAATSTAADAATAFIDHVDGDSASAGGPAGEAAVARGAGESSAWDEPAAGGPVGACSRSREAAETCEVCPSLLPTSGITVRQCCADHAARRACSAAATEALVDRALAISAARDEEDRDGDDSEDAEEDEEEESADVEKRAKYFLGKRAKYFLGKRSFGSRRIGNLGFGRPANMRYQLMAPSTQYRRAAAEKRAKYFLG